MLYIHRGTASAARILNDLMEKKLLKNADNTPNLILIALKTNYMITQCGLIIYFI